MTEWMTVRAFAAANEVDERTVQRWLKAGKLPGAVKTNKGWAIPADAAAPAPAPPAPAPSGPGTLVAAAVPGPPVPAALPPGGGLAAFLDTLPAFIALEVAERVLGIPESAIRRNADELGARPWGPRGTLVIPVRSVREAAGL